MKQPRNSRKKIVSTAVFFLAALIVFIFVLSPSPYVAERPGPVFNALGTSDVDGKQEPIITVPSVKAKEAKGTLNVVTVSVLGNPKQHLNWLDVFVSWINPSVAVFPVEAIFPPQQKTSQYNIENKLAMVSSQHEAIAAALINQGYDIARSVTVMSFSSWSPAASILKISDVIVSVNGQAVSSVTELKAALTKNGTTRRAQLLVRRDGEEIPLYVTPVLRNNEILLGIAATAKFTLPIKVTITLDNVGGPSAGLIFALAIIDKMTNGNLTNNVPVAGTGTIDSDGTVGPIGGIRQKIVGARDAGSQIFLVPEDNCAELSGHIPDGIRVFKVKDLSEAKNVLAHMKDKSSDSTLRKCL